MQPDLMVLAQDQPHIGRQRVERDDKEHQAVEARQIARTPMHGPGAQTNYRV